MTQRLKDCNELNQDRNLKAPPSPCSGFAQSQLAGHFVIQFTTANHSYHCWYVFRTNHLSLLDVDHSHGHFSPKLPASFLEH